MKRVILLIALLFIFCNSVFAQVYSLKELYNLALKKSEVIKISEEDLYISQQDIIGALSELIPTLSAFGSHTRYTDAQLSSGFLLQPDYSNEWGFSLENTYSLSGREIANYRIAKLGADAKRLEVYAFKEGYLLDVAVKYYSVLRAKREIEIAEANAERLTRQRDAAKKRVEVGESISTDLLRAEAELAAAESALIRAENQLRVAMNLLGKAAGIRGDFDVSEPGKGGDYDKAEEIEPYIEFMAGKCNNDILYCLRKLALSERADIRALVIRKEIAEKDVNATRSVYWPELSLEAVYAKKENHPSRSFELDEQIYGTMRLSFPFFEGGKKKAEMSKARARLKQAEYNLSDLKQTVFNQVEDTYNAVKTEAALITTRQEAVKFARENYRLVSKQFEHGLADSIDLIDANTLLVTSERELANATYIYKVAILRLKHATGTLLKSVTNGKR